MLGALKRRYPGVVGKHQLDHSEENARQYLRNHGKYEAAEGPTRALQ